MSTAPPTSAVQVPLYTTTRFASLNRPAALAILAGTAAAIAWCLWVVFTQETIPKPPANAEQAPGDADFYERVIRRVHDGEDYYAVVDSELRRLHYVPHSMFNWRTPTYAWLLARFPQPGWGRPLLGVFMAATVVLGFRAVNREGGPHRAKLCVVFLLIGPFAWCLFDPILFAELWSGTLLALSVAAYANDRVGLGVATGLLALFFRELALPYCLIAGGLAWWQKRRGEVAAWLIGLLWYGLFLMYHASQVAPWLVKSEALHASGWIQFNGTAFILLTTQINFFILAPGWAWGAALHLPLSLLGLAGWRGWNGLRAAATTTTFVAAFAVIGLKPHNAYWGLMYAPLLPFGIVWAPTALRDLYRRDANGKYPTSAASS